MKKAIFSLVFAGLCLISGAQDNREIIDSLEPASSTDTIAASISLNNVLDKFNLRTSARIESLSRKISAKSISQLAQLHDLENLLTHKLKGFDKAKAKLMDENIQNEYAHFQEQLKEKFPVNVPYQAMLDSISGMIAFQKLIPGIKKDLLELETQLKSLKENLSISAYLKIFSGERQSFLKDFLEKCGNIPTKYKNKYLFEYSKQLAIFNGRAEEWRKEINDPAKYEKLALLALNKLPVFKSFMQENGELSRLFGNPSTAISNISGLQTRSNFLQAMQQRGFNPANYGTLVQPQIQSAQAELNKAKEKLTSLESGEISNGNPNMQEAPFYNTQKIKAFLKRLEYGIDFQSGIRQYQFPSSNAIAISAGYKINDRFVSGVGFEYKFSLGNNLQHMQYTSDGIGFRSFLEYKISAPQKGVKVLFSNIWLSGGYEKSYWSRFKCFPELKSLLWTESGLIGISKKIHQNKRQLKTQVFWNFLAAKIGATPVLFRFGFTL